MSGARPHGAIVHRASCIGHRLHRASHRAVRRARKRAPSAGKSTCKLYVASGAPGSPVLWCKRGYKTHLNRSTRPREPHKSRRSCTTTRQHSTRPRSHIITVPSPVYTSASRYMHATREMQSVHACGARVGGRAWWSATPLTDRDRREEPKDAGCGSHLKPPSCLRSVWRVAARARCRWPPCPSAPPPSYSCTK